MNILALDLETTVQRRDGVIDGSPFHPSNRIVSAHWRWVAHESHTDGPQRAIFFHRDQGTPDSRKPLQDALDAADIIVAFNGKFDLTWLLESGFKYEGDIYDPMIGEYILARGQRWGFSLDETAKRRGVSEKRGHLVQEMFDNGMDFSEIPLDIVIEYADADVLATAEVYLAQMEEYNRPENIGLIPVRTLMNEMLLFLVEIERNGIKIDKVALDQIEKDYLAEQAQLLATLRDISQSVMGDMPINLNSGADMSKVIYSREVIDRDLHISTWNIGTDARGKPLRTPRMSPTEFSRAVKMTTRVIERQTAFHCQPCSGTGLIRKVKKNGEPYKSMNKCPDCTGRGVQLVNSGQKAGLKLVPSDSSYACVHGFKSDKGTIKRLIAQAHSKGLVEAEVFLKALSRLNAVSSYLSSFVNGINFWCRDNDILHANFNQCVTATGRLSSSHP